MPLPQGRKSRLLVVVVVLLAASLVLALLALLVPPPTDPLPSYVWQCPPPSTWHIGHNCWKVLLHDPSQTAVESYSVLLLLHQGYGDLAVGFGALAALYLLALVLVPRVPRGPHVPVPRAVRDVALLGALAGLVVFAVFVFLDVVTTPVLTPGPFIFRNLLSANVGYYTHGGTFYYDLGAFGKAAFAVFAVASSCAFIYRLSGGVTTALGKTVTLFAAPVLTGFEIALILFTPVNMPIQATEFLRGTLLAGILTNWFVLVISAGLFALGLTHRRLGLAVRRETQEIHGETCPD